MDRKLYCRIKFFLLISLISQFVISSDVYAQNVLKKISREEYIEKYKSDAIKDMLKHGIPASIKLAQAMLESDNGNSDLSRNANNHFGIKCHKEWSGEKYIKDDDAKDECFRKYPSVFDSYFDHSEFLRTRPRYSFLFELPRDDYRRWAEGLKSAGYATNPKYAELLIKIIEDNKLNDLDKTTTAIKNGQPKEVIKDTGHSGVSLSHQGKNNGTPIVYVQKGDTYTRIARRMNIMPWQVLKYNDIDKNMPLTEGQIIYIKPKRNKGSDAFHIAEQGETWWLISQKYGIKLKSLKAKNNSDDNVEPASGQRISLRKKVKVNSR